MKTKIKNLADAISKQEPEDADFYCNFISERLETFTNYFNAVYKDVLGMEINKSLRDSGRIPQEEFERRVLDNDNSRHKKHDLGIDACNQLNRLCEKYGVEPFCPDGTDRYKVADFIGTFVYNVYESGIGQKSLDKAIELARANSHNPDRAYNPKQVKKEVGLER